MNDTSINYALKIVIQAKNGALTAIYNSKFSKNQPIPNGPTNKEVLKHRAQFEEFMANLSDGLSVHLLTQQPHYRPTTHRL